MSLERNEYVTTAVMTSLLYWQRDYCNAVAASVTMTTHQYCSHYTFNFRSFLQSPTE